MTAIFVKPTNPTLKVQMSGADLYTFFPPEGMTIEESFWIYRRVKDGSLEITDPPAKKAKDEPEAVKPDPEPAPTSRRSRS
jgi:hypothetical protein